MYFSNTKLIFLPPRPPPDPSVGASSSSCGGRRPLFLIHQYELLFLSESENDSYIFRRCILNISGCRQVDSTISFGSRQLIILHRRGSVPINRLSVTSCGSEVPPNVKHTSSILLMNCKAFCKDCCKCTCLFPADT